MKFDLYLLGVWPTQHVQELFLALYPVITPGVHRDHMDAGIKPRSAACRANALPLCYSSGLSIFNFQGASWKEPVVQWGSHFLALPDLSMMESGGQGHNLPQNQGPSAVLESALPSFTGGSKVHLITGHLPQALWVKIGENWAVPRAYNQSVCVKGAVLLSHGPTQMCRGRGCASSLDTAAAVWGQLKPMLVGVLAQCHCHRRVEPRVGVPWGLGYGLGKASAQLSQGPVLWVDTKVKVPLEKRSFDCYFLWDRIWEALRLQGPLSISLSSHGPWLQSSQAKQFRPCSGVALAA